MAIVWKDVISGYSKVGVDWAASSTNTTVTYAPIVYLYYTNISQDSWINYSWNLSAAGTTVGSDSKTGVDSGKFSGSKQFFSTGSYSISKGNSSKTLTLSLNFSDLYGGYGQDWTGNWSGTWTYTVPALTSYTISYNANGGAGAPSNQTKYYGTTLKLSTTKPTRNGYTFLNWNTKADGSGTTYASGANYTANSTITLYAMWRQDTFIVSYDANGGTNAPSNQTKYYGETLVLSDVIPTRDSVKEDGILIKYVFHGWATSSTENSVQYKAGASYTKNEAIVLHAVWGRILIYDTYNITYDSNGGSGIISQIKTHGKDITLRNIIPVKKGYVFTGWGLSSDAIEVSYKNGDTYSLNENVVLYAMWSPCVHEVVFDLNGGEGNVPDGFEKITGIDVIIPETLPIRDGCVFRCWSTSNNNSNGKYYYVGDNYTNVQNGGTVTLYAVWDEKKVAIFNNKNIIASSFIEDSGSYFKNNGMVYANEFIENDIAKLSSSEFYFNELIER